MKAQIIDGRHFAEKQRHQTKQRVDQWLSKGLPAPTLVVILVGDDPASHIYVSKKEQACREVGIHSKIIRLPANTSQKALIDTIHSLNQDKTVNGILLQLPLPDSMDPLALLESISPDKDVDGFHPYNLGRLAQRCPNLRPCTSHGVMQLLSHIDIDPKGKHAVIVGASNLVGRPMSLECLLAGATVTICHRFTRDLARHVSQADLLISAVGRFGIVDSEWIKQGAVVMDIGITRRPDGKITGDIDFESAKQKASWITPVPGGVGPMTVANLLSNTLQATHQQHLLTFHG